MREWAQANNVELAYTPHYASWLNRIEPQFKGLRYFCLAGTDHPDHDTQARLITGYIDWRNDHRDDPKLRHLTRRELARKAAPPTRRTLPDAPLASRCLVSDRAESLLGVRLLGGAGKGTDPRR